MTSLLLTKEFHGYSPALAFIRNSSRVRGRKYRNIQVCSASALHSWSSLDDLLNRQSIPRSMVASASTSSSIDYRLRLMESLPANERLRRSISALMMDKRRNWRITAAIFDLVMGYLDDANQLTAEDADFLFRCCGRLTPAAPPAKRVQYLKTLWNSLPRLGLAHDLAAYIRLQQMLLQNHQMFSAAGFLERVRKAGFEPNGYLYVGSIIRCAMDDKPDFVEIDGYLEALKKMPVEKDVWLKARGAYISAQARARNTEKLRELLEEEKAEAAATNQTEVLNQYYFSYASISAQHGDMATVFKMIDQARRSDASLTDYQLLYLVRWLVKTGNQASILRVLNYMPKEHNWIYRTLPSVLVLAADGYCVPALTVLQRSATATAATAYPPPGQSSAEESQELIPKSANVYHFLLDLFYLKLPTTQITAFCRRLVDCGYSDEAFQQAAVAAIDANRTDAATSLLEDGESRLSRSNLQSAKASEQSKQQEPIGSLLRPHHFYHALRMRSLLGDVDAILALLKRMETMGLGYMSTRTLSHSVLRYFYSPTLDMSTIFAVFGTVASRKNLLTAAVCVCLRQGDGQRVRAFLKSDPKTRLQVHSKDIVSAICEYYRKTYDSSLVIDIVRTVDERQTWKTEKEIHDECGTLVSSIYNFLKEKLSKSDLEDFASALEREGFPLESCDQS